MQPIHLFLPSVIFIMHADTEKHRIQAIWFLWLQEDNYKGNSTRN